MCGMSQQHPTRSAAARPARPDAWMSLLAQVMEHGLDDGYAEAAARRGGSRLPQTVRAKAGLAVGLLLAAALITLGAAQTQHSASATARENDELADRINTADHRADRTERDVRALRRSVDATRAKLLKPDGTQDRAALAELLGGATDVTGPGVRLVVDDAKEAEQGGDGSPTESADFSDTGRVRDRDLQRVVNGLWASGAEAVSVNGQRLTALSAIRAAGDAILVDNRPLPPPYTVLAIGDGKRLSAAFQDSADGRYLRALEKEFDIRAHITVREKLTLPAAPSLTVRYASPAPARGGAKVTEPGRGKGTS